MATYVTYNPTTIIGKAMFNFDMYGISNFKLDGVVRVSVSDAFSYTDWYNSDPRFYKGLYYNTTGSNEVAWTTGQTGQTGNIEIVLDVYSQFAHITTFPGVADYDTTNGVSIANPADVGRLNVSDINITWLSRSDVDFSAISGGGSDDQVFDYTGGAGDIFLNRSASNFSGVFTLAPTTKGAQILMHELGHSFGLSHPHSSYSNGTPTITSDYAATQYLGFSQLGFRTNSSDDMYKEYFTIMSYDDQRSSVQDYRAYTPMILDVIALQQAYGEGSGTTESGNDKITPGNAGYRTYFDTGGIDTIDLSGYTNDMNDTNGAYLNMGEVIDGAAHLVGVSMSLDDSNTIKNGGNPTSLRWFYGEFEKAIGSSQADVIYGTDFANDIKGGGGNDTITGGPGDDYIDGGLGIDTAVYSGVRANYVISPAPQGFTVSSAAEGTDTLTNVEFAQFSNQTIQLTVSSPIATKAKVFLGADGSFSVNNNGASIYGSAGNNAVTIGSGATGVLLDQNIERINFSDASSNYNFKQTGNLINIYDASGITLLAKAPVQGDSNGTVLSYSDGTAAAKLADGVMTLGDAALNSVTARVLVPATTTSDASTANFTKAKVFLGADDDNFTVSDSGITLYGNTGKDVVMIAPWVTGVSIDQNVERINLYGASNDYAFRQTGNIINIYDISGTLLLAKAPVQGDVDGTLLSFDNGIAEAHLTGGVMRLGVATANASIPTTLHPFG
ncbi:MAG: hypothetical protein WCL71_04890 [Deltaproteobacteria bacterium]